MSVKERLARAVQDLPEDLTVEEAFDRLYQAFQDVELMRRADRAMTDEWEGVTWDEVDAELQGELASR